MKMVIKYLAGYQIKHPSNIAVLLCILLPSLPATADTVEVKLPSGIAASANFHIGNPSQPAVLLLHGFLQTHHSPPMSSLASNLASRGYTVLNPTISLGINRRSQSMACEAVHTHTINEEVAEVAFWVNWLSNKGYTNIVPIGFSSTGNLDILLYNAQGSHPEIKSAILTSLNPIFTDSAERQKYRAAGESKRPSDLKKLGIFSLGYCKNNFAATENSYLSYAQYDGSKVLELIKRTPVQIDIILGSADAILPDNFASQIKALKTHTRVTFIDKANHFFDGTYEFDLAEEVENILKNLPAK
jgi:dienelactone hydrolase